MKKFLKISGIIVCILLLLMLTLPIVFKGKIKRTIDEHIDQNINGHVWYNASSFQLSLFNHFPDLSVSISDIGLLSHVKEFKGDTLFAASEFNLSLDIMSVISGDQIKIKGITLNKPEIKTIINKDGKSSWDIFKTDTSSQPSSQPEQPSKVGIAVDKWEINDATIIYDDHTMPLYVKLNHFNHSGSGNFASDIFDLKSNTTCPNVSVIYDGTTYLNKYSIDADVTMNIDLIKSIYTFKENQFTVNAFRFGFDGKIEMSADDIKMDITYKATETEFKNILSLIPAIFSNNFDKIKTTGTIGFDGYVKGTYNASSMPGFGLNMFIKNGFFQYPDLPEAVKAINMDMQVINKDGIIDHTLLNLKQFHMELGQNPIDAKLLVNGMNPYDLDAILTASLKLEDLEKFYPISGTSLKGLFTTDIKAKGKYSDSLKLMPTINANMHLSNGYVKSSEFPEPIRDINLSATATSDGNMKTSTFLLDYFKLMLDGEAFEIKAFIRNFDDPNYEATLKGIIDFAKMTKIYPIEGTTLTGQMKADINTKGILSEVQAGKYQNTKSSGTMDFTNLFYKSSDLPQGFVMKTGNVNFSPDHLTLSGMNGFVGKSDYTMNGSVSNYIGYLFGGKDTIIHGNINFNSTKFDVNEWMSDDTVPTSSKPSTNAPAQATEIPFNIDVVLNADLKEVLYSNMTMTDMAGSILVKNGIVTMKNLGFNSMGGSFLTNGNYNAQDIRKPAFDMNMQIENLAIQEAYKTIGTIKKLAPIANYVEGNINMSVRMNGLLDQDMMPVYATLNGKGTLGMASAKILKNPVTGGIVTLTQIRNIDPMEIKDIKINYTIQDGNLVIAPFTIKADKTEISILKGLNKYDGFINYDLELNTPSGSLSSAAGSILSKFAGSTVSLPPNVIIDLNLTGPYDKPKVKILKTNLGEASKTTLKNAAMDQIMNSQQAKQLQQQADQVKQQAQDELKKQQDAAQQQLNKETKVLEQKNKQAEDSTRKKAADALKKSLPKF
jgi:hypothetical protein